MANTATAVAFEAETAAATAAEADNGLSARGYRIYV